MSLFDDCSSGMNLNLFHKSFSRGVPHELRTSTPSRFIAYFTTREVEMVRTADPIALYSGVPGCAAFEHAEHVMNNIAHAPKTSDGPGADVWCQNRVGCTQQGMVGR